MRTGTFARVAGACLLGSCLICFAQTAPRAKGATPAPRPGAQARLKGDAVAGRDKADAERCTECHGAQGQGDGHTDGSDTRFPKLAGQHDGYLVRQLQNYRSGLRKHDVMRLNAQRLDEADLLDIAAYFATRPPMHGDGKVRADANPGQLLFAQGDAARNILACAGCHGERGTGASAAPLVPILSGQDARYLAQQLLDWRSGWRTEAAGGVMNQVAKALTDSEIRALADYLAAQP